MRFLINPKSRRRSTGKRKASTKRKRKLAGAALAAHQKKAGRSRRRTNRRTRATVGGTSMAKRKRRRAASTTRRTRRHVARRSRRRVHRNPVTRMRRKSHRRRFRRNPPSLSGKGLLKTATQGVKDAALILVGKAGTRYIANMIPLPTTMTPGTANIVRVLSQVAVAIGVGYIAQRSLGTDAARMVVAGGIMAPLETALKTANIPVLSANLGDATGAAGASLAIRGPDGSGMDAYPLAAYPGADQDAAAYGDHGMMGW